MRYESQLFTDSINGKSVNLYIDDYGTKWMAQSRWGFRTEIEGE